jgi:hypothetical protein
VKLVISTLFAALCWFFAAALNVPVWSTWAPGDRTDIALVAGLLAFWTMKWAKA